ncbi:alanine racemase [Salinarimonas sp. NSM]|uniref:alanine racemase n=1 Tax=Salinarimonas sp. NSM TaxID=3458003 RepID=UPI004035F22B
MSISHEPADDPHDDGLPGADAATLTIDLDALGANWRFLRDRSRDGACAAVVKANAYGTGIERAVPALARAGCRTFFVAQVSEGRRVRRVDPTAEIYLLDGLPPGGAGELIAANLRPVLGSADEVREWIEACGGTALPAALHVDTGMNRLGLPVEEALALQAQGAFAGLGETLLMTHLVVAEDPDHAINARQTQAFRALIRAFPGVRTSFANSSGGFLPDAPACDLARPGYSLYGGNPTPHHENPMRPVVRLEATILQVRDVPAGAGAGYGTHWTAPSPRRLATLALGYADGYPRAAGGTDAKTRAGTPYGQALVGGVRCPFAGVLSMDLTILDVTDAPDAAARRGGTAVLIGDGLDIDEVGMRAGTIGYEILTGLGDRYRRVYVGDGGGAAR